MRDTLARAFRENWLFLLVLTLLVVGFLYLRTPATALASVEEVDAVLQDGQPTFVEFYSNT
jgi:hypothetical protein